MKVIRVVASICALFVVGRGSSDDDSSAASAASDMSFSEYLQMRAADRGTRTFRSIAILLTVLVAVFAAGGCGEGDEGSRDTAATTGATVEVPTGPTKNRRTEPAVPVSDDATPEVAGATGGVPTGATNNRRAEPAVPASDDATSEVAREGCGRITALAEDDASLVEQVREFVRASSYWSDDYDLRCAYSFLAPKCKKRKPYEEVKRIHDEAHSALDKMRPTLEKAFAEHGIDMTRPEITIEPLSPHYRTMVQTWPGTGRSELGPAEERDSWLYEHGTWWSDCAGLT